jgi:TolB-like protein/class 3 adenylate cyclase
VKRRLAAIFAADVEGYSRLMGADEVATLDALTARREILDGLIGTHGGRIANTAGDSVLAEFGSAVDAVRCAMEAQDALAKANLTLPEDRHINFRMGVHVGDVMVRAGDLFGDGVNIAARLQTLARAGGLCISGVTYDQVRKILPLEFTDLGAQTVKNIEEPVRAYEVKALGEGAFLRSKEPPMLAVGAKEILTLPDKPSIAVLPFQNMSGDPEQEYFADGMVEDIITALSRFRSLFVIARNSSFTYKGRAVDVKQVGRELGVRYVLEGSVRRAANRVRIVGQLIDASTGAHLWADRFDGALDDIFDLQDKVTASVVGAIAPKLERAEIERAKRKPTESLDAYDYYLRGIASIHLWTKEANAEALRLFYRASELDPDFATTYGMAAWCYVWRKMNGWMIEPARDIAETKRLAGRASSLGKDDAVALSFGGHALVYVASEVEAGAALVDRALVLNPNLAAAWTASGWVRTVLGDTDAMIEHMARAMRLSPLDPLKFSMQAVTALGHFFAGRFSDAASWAEKAVQEQPNFLITLRAAAASYASAGRSEDAHKAIARALQLDPDMRVSNLKDRLSLLRPEHFIQYVDALREAGLPE